MQVNVRSNIDQVLKGMATVSREVVDTALPRALNRVIEMARTETARSLVADGYNYKVSEIKQALRIVKASRGRRGVRMLAPRGTKSLMEFDPRESKAGVTVKVHKTRKLIRGAFIGQLQNGRFGVYVEDKAAGKLVLRRAKQHKKGSVGGWQAYPVRKLYGPSIGGVFVNDKLQQSLDKFVATKFEERLRVEVRRLTR
ncbi:MAG: phage tail protein [Leptothrix sp. (in: b-proteobacteria)]